MRADQERVKKLLVDTVTLLCKNGLFYQEELRVEGLLGVTLDGSDVFFVHISQKLLSGEEPRTEILLPSDLTLAPNNSHNDIKDEGTAADVIIANNKMPEHCHDNRIVMRPSEDRGQHSRSVSPLRYHQSSRSSIHSDEDSEGMSDGQDLRRGTKRDQEENNSMEGIKYLRRPDPSSRVPMPQDDSELVHPQGVPGEPIHPNLSQFDQLIAAANQASSGEAGGGILSKRRPYTGGGEPGAHVPPPSGAFVTGIARAIHGEAANAQGPGGGGAGNANDWPNTTSAIEMAAHLAQSHPHGQLSVDTSALASTSSWPNTPISSAGGPGVAQFGSADMLMYGSLGYLASAMEQHGKLTVSPAPQVAIVSEVVNPPPIVAAVPNVSCPKPAATTTGKKRRPKASGSHHQGASAPTATGSSDNNTKNRRSWLTKGKPYVCSYPGCRRSYFYQHDVKRHYKQQHSVGPEDQQQLLLGDRHKT